MQGWARKRLAEGWTWGPRVDDRAMRHNCLVPFDFLTEPEKDMERAGVTETVKIIIGPTSRPAQLKSAIICNSKDR